MIQKHHVVFGYLFANSSTKDRYLFEVALKNHFKPTAVSQDHKIVQNLRNLPLLLLIQL